VDNISYLVWALGCGILWLFIAHKLPQDWQGIFIEVMLIIVVCALVYAIYEVMP